MIFIFAQKGATSLGFQVGRVELSITYRKYWGNLKVSRLRNAIVIDLPQIFCFRV